MKIDKNDPRLTAYVLNELSNSERILIEQAMRENAELKAEVELLKGAVSVLQEFPTEPAYRLSPAQREKVLSRKSAGWNWWPVIGGLTTAGLALMLVLKNPVSSNSAAQLQQEKSAKLEAVSETKNANAVADAAQAQKVKPEARGGALAPEATVAAREAQEDLAEAQAPAAAAAPAQIAREEEVAGQLAQADSSAKADLALKDSMPQSAASNLALGSGGQAMMARSAAPKKMATSWVRFVLVTDETRAGGAISLDAEIQNQVLPVLQKCSLAGTKSDLTVTVRLTLEGTRVIKTRLEQTNEAGLSAEVLDCLQTAQPQSLQNSGGLREHVYKLKTVSK